MIRNTGEPYINHLTAVAEMAGIIPLGYEIGLCHNLFKDTKSDHEILQAALSGFGYDDDEAVIITECIAELTDVFNKKAYPGFSKKHRKEKEAERLATISPAAQTVKYADLIYNINWVLTYDLQHAAKYLSKKRDLLRQMKDGDRSLRNQVFRQIVMGLSEFS